MMDVVKFRIPALFVNERVALNAAEIVYGYQNGWIDEVDAGAVAVAAYSADCPLPQSAEDLALLLTSDLARVPELIDQVNREISVEAAEGADGVWLYLALAWLYEHRDDHLEPLEVIEQLYADFDYPDEIAGLVRFMPLPPGAESGHRAIEQRWAQYLDIKSAELHARRLRLDRSP